MQIQEEFEQAYMGIEKSLYLVAIGYLHNTEDARDAVQEAVVSAYQSYGRLKHREYFKTWLTRIVINKCKDFIRKRRITVCLDDNCSAFYDMPESDMEIIDAVCRLDIKFAPYITLRFYNGMTFDEVAKLLRQPVSTVKYRTKTAMEQLKNMLEEGM